MKIAKKPLVLLLTLVMTLAIGLYGCKGEGDTPTPPVPSIEKIEITNTETNIGAGDLLITAKCSPEGIADTDYTVKIDAKSYGVSLDGKTLKVHPGALNGQTVSVTVTSTADTNKTANKTFTVAVDDAKVTYEEISTGDQLFAAFGSEATSESMAKNYKLTGNIEISRVDGKGDSVLTRWSPSALPFTGLLDGKGYSINGLNMPYSGATAGAGFFKVNKGVVRNIGFDNSGDAAYSNHWMNLGANSGVVAGINDGGIANVYTNVITASTTGAVGAIVGTNNGFLVNSYALGVLNCNDTEGNKAGVVAINNGAVIGTVADKETTKLTSFVGNAAGQNDEILNAKLLSSKEMQTTATYSGMTWDESVWYFTNVYPMFKTADFDETTAVEKNIEIVSTRIVEVGGYADNKPLQLEIKATNAAHDEVVWELINAEEVPGVTFNATTGVITFDEVSKVAGTAGKYDGITLRVKVSLKSDDTVTANGIFSLRDDGYNQETGIVVNNEKELYDTFFKTVDGNVGSDLSAWSNRALDRTIKLNSNIALSAPISNPGDGNAAGTWSGNPKANWRGVGGTHEDTKVAFTGIFDGQGYAITGLNIKIDSGNTFMSNHPYKGAPGLDANAAWGFFRTIGTKEGKPGVVRNLVIKDGVVDCTLGILNGGRREIGGIAQYFYAGTIENCVVDLDISTSTNYAGMVVGRLEGSESVGNAKREGSTRIINTIAMGSIKSALKPGNSPLRPAVDPYAVGGFAAYTEGRGPEFINCYAMGEKTDSMGFTCRIEDDSDGSLSANVTNYVNSGFKTMDEILLASTYEGKFDSNIWFFKDGYFPTLRYKGFDESKETLAPPVVKITNERKEIISAKDIGAGLQITTKLFNAKDKTPVFSLAAAVTGVDISESGLLTVDDKVAAIASDVTVNVTLGEGSVGDSYTFSLVNDDYDAAVGIAVSNEDELYDVFFGAKKDLNLTRNIHLTKDIELNKYANWPGVNGTFKGNFNGRGYSITGLNVTDTVANDGYGFFKNVKADTKDQVVIENLGIKGSINGKGQYVSVLAKRFTGGTIKNVLIDASVKSNSDRCGKMIGFMEGSCQILSSITMGHISSTNNDHDSTDASQWLAYECGALIGYTNDGRDYNFYNCYALRCTATDCGTDEVANIPNVGFNTRRGQELCEVASWDKTINGFKTEAEMKTGTAFVGFEDTNWTFAENAFPTLKVQA